MISIMEYIYESTQALSVGEVTFDTAWPLSKFLLLCPALFYSALGHHLKVEGHSKKIFPALRLK